MKNLRSKELKKGVHVQIALKEDQKSNKLTEGFIKDILTKSDNHPYG